MKWSETTASKCRYGDIAERIFGEAEVIWEHSEADWQGFANILVHMPDGRFGHYEWTYGSCSGCDEWENLRVSGADPYSSDYYERRQDAVEQIMREATAWFDDEATLRRYLQLEDSDTTYPTANTPTNGGLSGMLHILSGEVGADFHNMGHAFDAWSRSQQANVVD